MDKSGKRDNGRQRKTMKKRKKDVRYVVFAVLILTACVVPVAFLYIRKKREKTGKDGITERKAKEKKKAEHKVAKAEKTEKESAEKETVRKIAETTQREPAEKEESGGGAAEIKAEEKTVATAQREPVEKEDPERKKAEKKEAEIQEETSPSEILIDEGRSAGRMKKAVRYAGYGLYFALILGICIVPLVFLQFRPGGGTTEKRAMASLPEIWTAEGFNWNYLSEAGDYFTDHFAFREEIVAADSGIRSRIFGVSSTDDVIAGKNGWLYYTATLDDYQHKNSVSERMLFNMAHNTALMQEYTEGLGKTFLFTVAPNKNTLYDENMPDRLRFRVAEKNDAARLLPWLDRENVNYVNLFDLFEGQEEVLYYARDSHWNEKGAVLVYNTLLDACGKPHETYGDAEPVQKKDYFGDLELMLFPVGGRAETRLQYPIADTWRYVEGENVEDQFIRTENEEGEGNLLMYRDSFGNSLLPYMAQTFSQAVFSKRVPYTMSDLVTCEPDVVVVERVERHLPTLGMVPPLMSAPLRESEKVCVAVKNAAATLQLSKEGSYWKFEGAADAAYMDTDSRVYVEVNDGSGAKLYEAFCVGRRDAEGGVTNDYGYALYISEVLVTGNVFDVRVMTEQDEAMVVLLEREIQG